MKILKTTMIVAGLTATTSSLPRISSAYYRAHPDLSDPSSREHHSVVLQVLPDNTIAYSGAAKYEELDTVKGPKYLPAVQVGGGVVSFRDACSENQARALTGIIQVLEVSGPKRCDRLPKVGTNLADYKR